MREIPLSRGMVALVDNEDYEWLSQWKWQAKRSPPNHWSAYGRVNGRHIHLGVYSELSDAVFVRKSKEKELFGEFGNENR